MAIYLLTPIKNAMSALELKRQMGVSYNTAWRLKSKVLHVMKEREDWRPLDGLVLIDNAYTGAGRAAAESGDVALPENAVRGGRRMHPGRSSHAPSADPGVRFSQTGDRPLG